MNRKVVDSHYHVYGWTNWENLDMFQSLKAYQEGAGLEAVNLCALPCLHEKPFCGVENNIMMALCKLRDPKLYISGGITYPEFPVPAQLPEGMDPLTQYKELMEIGFDGIKMLETKPTEAKAIGRPVNDPLYEPYFAELEEKGTHIVWHVNDPLDFWDPKNAPENCQAAGWWYGDGTFPTKEEIYTQVFDVLDRHPKLNITFAHFFFLSDEIDRLKNVFAKYPNVCVDLTPGVELYGSFGKDLAFFHDFFTEYADRVVYGTDASDWGTREENVALANEVYRFLTTDEDVKFWIFESKGVKLGEKALEKILRGNFLEKIGGAPKPINVEALKAYVKKYRHMVLLEDLGEHIDEEMAKL